MQIKELGHVVLYVTNLEASVRFYRDTLGFRLIGQQPGVAAFSAGRTHHELLLIEVGGQPRIKHAPEPGLYHIGFKIGDTREELLAAVKELDAAGVPLLGATDHTVSHSLYIEDPDGNELELYIDVTDEWKQKPDLVLARAKPLNYL